MATENPARPRLASLPQRVAAFLIDLCIALAISLPFLTDGIPLLSKKTADVVFIALLSAYLLFRDAVQGQSVGKNVVGIRVKRSNGAPCGLIRSLVRNLFLIDFVFIVTALIDWMAWAYSYRRFGDVVARTVVITTKLYTSDGDQDRRPTTVA